MGETLQLKAISASSTSAPGVRDMATVCKFIDTTTCIGCKACEVACQEWNDLPPETTVMDGTYQTLPDMTPNFWNLIRFAEHEEEGERVRAGGAVVPEHADVGDDQQRRSVEGPLRPARPLGDLAPPLAPYEVDEERDREQERDLRHEVERRQRRLELEHDDHGGHRRDDQQAPERRVDPAHAAQRSALTQP